MTLEKLLARLHSLPDNKNKGAGFELLGKWWLENSPIFGRLDDPPLEVWRWADWPGSWGPDRGIDLVVRTRRGQLWAVQAKGYQPKSSISKGDVDSFLSESARPVFSRRILLSSTDRISAGALGTIRGQEKPVERYGLRELLADEVCWPDSLDDLRPARPEPKRPRPHQSRALRAIKSGLKEQKRGQAIMSCGTGKTLVGLWSAERLEARRTLVLVPSLALMAQTIREWTANGEDFTYLPVCSERGVAGEGWGGEAGIPSATTDPEEIRRFLRRRSGRRVLFSTYQSAAAVAEALDAARVPQFDLIVFDEAHNCTGAGGAMFSRALDDRYIPARRRLFFTATPRVVTYRGDGDLDVVSMDDPELFGPELFRIDFAEAIDRGLLTDYQVVISAVDSREALDAARDEQHLEIQGGELDGETFDSRGLAAQVALARVAGQYKLKKVITFHNRVENARQFAGDFPKICSWIEQGAPDGPVVAKHVTGAMGGGRREALLADFRRDDQGLRVLANARCLAEGVDVPSVDGVAFIDPRRSGVEIIQAIGRVLRRSPGKHRGTIFVPVHVGEGDDAASLLQGGAFTGVWQVLLALRAHDTSLAAEIDALRRAAAAGEPVSIPGRIIVDLPEAVTGPDFAEHFSAMLVRETSESWDRWFGLLEEYVKEHGSADPSQRYSTPSGEKLGVWCSNNRHRRELLSSERRRRLEALPGWSWDPKSSSWESGLRSLEKYVARNGTATPPSGYRDPEGGRKIGDWAETCRRAWRAGKLDKERSQRLEALPGWSWNPQDDAWEYGFQRLVEYRQATGQPFPTAKFVAEDGYSLGAWCHGNRQKGRDGSIDPERARRLQALPGWCWDPIEAAWQKAFRRLEDYSRQHGHESPTQSYVSEDGFKLGGWCGENRLAKRRGKLDPERARLLETVPGWSWNPKDEAWSAAFSRLEAYMEEHGDPPVSRYRCSEDGFALGQWCARVRAAGRGGRLKKDQRKRLEALPDWAWS